MKLILSRHSFTRIVQVKCNDSATPFHIHANPLRRASTQVQDLLDQQAASNVVNVLKLTLDVAFDGFEVLARWLYDGKVRIRNDNLSPSPPAECVEDDIRTLCEAYRAGEQWSIVPFQDAVMDGIVERLTWPEQYYDEAITVGYLLETMLAAFPAGSRGRAFVVDWLVYGNPSISLFEGDIVGIIGEDQDFCRLFTIRSMVRSAEEAEEEVRPWHTRRHSMPCRYHVHKLNVEPCHRPDFDVRDC